MIACINGKLTTIQNPSQLVQGTVGQKMRVAIPEEMEDLAVTAVFTAGSVQRDVAVLGEEITIPWEVLADPAQDLRLCFHASSANGQRVFTTADSDPLKILPSTQPSGQSPEAPTPTRADQIQALAEDALAVAQSVRRDADSGAFDGTDGVNGQNGISPLVAVSETPGGHTISITDAEGVKSFDVLDGADGEVLQSDLDELEASVADTLETKADINGSYDDMTVGNAGQLVSTVYTTDRTPYLFRTAGGSADIGDRLTEKLIGGTIAWNQLAKALTTAGTYSDVAVTVSNGVFTANGTANANISQGLLSSPISAISGHKYLLCGCQSGGSSSTYSLITTGASITGNARDVGRGKMFSAASTGTFTINLAVASGVQLTNAKFVPQLFDLTQMFGSAIADYIYTLEQNTAGAGAAYFRKLFPKPYYAYDAGSLQSVKASAHKTVGFNALNTANAANATNVVSANDNGTITIKDVSAAQWSSTYLGYADVVAENTYAIEGDVKYGRIGFSANTAYPSSSNTPDAGWLTSYSGAGNAINSGRSTAKFTPHFTGRIYMFFCTDNNSAAHQVFTFSPCLHLVWDGERNGEYEAYVQHTYPLDSDLELRGIPKLDANNSLYYDGDEYASDGTVTRKYGTRAYQSGDESLADAITDGTNTVYKLAAPATESADAFQNPQIVDDFGTEEYVDAAVAANTRDVAVPVGHDTNYQANLRAKLEMAPVSPGSDGDYIVRHTNGQNSYIAYTDGGRISGLEERLPAPPSVDGSYCLRVTISGGAAQYTWAAC